MAERLAIAAAASACSSIDRRPHIAGNAYDYVDEHGVLVHRYGPHIFHTNAEQVVDYLSHFTDWRPYEHRVWRRSTSSGCRCRSTAHDQRALRARPRDRGGGRGVLRRARASRSSTSARREDAVVAKVGRDLYEKFFRGYTRKQWERDPSELHASVCARIPIRTNTDDRYFTDGTRACRPTATPRCSSACSTTRTSRSHSARASTTCGTRSSYGHLVYTGPIDAYFDYRFGALPYRSLEFELRNEPTPDGGLVQPGGVGELPERGRAVHAHHRVPAHDRADAARLARRSRSSTRAPRATRTTRSPSDEHRGALRRYETLGRRARRRDLRRPAGALPVPEHGPGRGAGALDVRAARLARGVRP